MRMTIQEAIRKYGLGIDDDLCDAISLAITDIYEKAEREDPKPLTLEELRQMIGEPVWTVGVSYNGNSWQGWDIIERVDHDGICFGYSTEFAEWWSYNLRDADGTLCGCSWCAYRHRPKEVQE